MAGILESMGSTANGHDTLENYPAIETEIVLSSIREACESDTEFANLMNSAACEMALYDVIDNAEIATEAAKRIVIQNFKAANFNRIVKRTAIRLAMVDNDPYYTKYRKYRDLMLEAREHIYTKYNSKATKEARRIIMNSRRKAGNMTSPAGKVVVSKIDEQIQSAAKKVTEEKRES